MRHSAIDIGTTALRAGGRGRFLIPIALLALGLLIDVTLYTYAAGQLALVVGAGDATVVLHQVALPLLLFNVVLLLSIVLPFSLLQLQFYQPVELQEEMVRQKQSFLRMAEDAIRNPLTSLRWIIEGLVGPAEATSPEQREHLQEMSDGIYRLIAQTNELLHIGQLTHGFVHYHPQAIAVETVLAPAVRAVQPLLASRGQSLAVTPTGDASFYVDAPLVSHVMQIVLSNASVVSPRGSMLILALQSDADVVRLVLTRGVASAPPHDAPSATSPVVLPPFNMTVSREILKAAGGALEMQDDPHALRYVLQVPRRESAYKPSAIFDV